MFFKNNGALLTVLLIVLVDVLGFTIMIPLLPFYAESLGATPFVVGMISSIYGLCSLVAGPILGDLSDRHGRRIVLLLSQIGTFIGFVVLALSHTLWVIFISRIIDGITAGNITVAQAYISDVTEPKDRTRAMGLIGAAFGIGFILGPAISSLLIGFGMTAPIWASAALSLVSIIGTTLFLKDVRKNNEASEKHKLHTKLKNELKKYRHILGTPILKEYFALFFIFSMSFSLYITGLPLYSERALRWNEHAFTPKEVALLFSYMGITSLIIQVFFMGKLVKLLGENKLILVGFASTALAFIIMGYSPILSIFLIGMSISTFGNAVLRPAISSMLSLNASREHQGLVFGVNQTLMSIAQIICPLISGFLIGKEWTLYWCLLISFISFIGLYITRIVTTQFAKAA